MHCHLKMLSICRNIGSINVMKSFPLYISQAISALLPFLLAPIIIKSGGVELYGIYAAYLLISQSILLLSEYSFEYLGPRLIADVTGSLSQTKVVYCHVLLAKMILMLLAIILLIPIFYVVLNRFPYLIEVLLLFLFMLGQAMLAPWFYIATKKITELSILIIFSKLVTLMCSFTYIVNTPVISSEGNAVWLFAFYVLPTNIIGFFSCCSKVISLNDINFCIIKDYLKKGSNVFKANFFAGMQNLSGAYFVATFSTVELLGIYTAIDRLSRLLSAVFKPILQYNYPQSILNYRQSFNLGHKRMMHFILGFLLIGVGSQFIIFLFGYDILLLVYDLEVAKHVLLFSILVLWINIGLLNNAIGIQGLLAYGADRCYSQSIFFCFIFTIIFCIFFSKFDDYIYLVGVGVSLGELVAFAILVFNYIKIYKAVIK